MLRYCMCMCMCTFLDESLLIKVGESFEMVTNGVALFKEIQNGCLQLDSAATGCTITSTRMCTGC